jgi:primosomal protein N'
MTETDSELYKLITGLGKQAAESDSEKEGSESPTVVNEDLSDVDIKSDVDEDELRHPKIERRLSVSTMRRASMLSAREAKLEAIRDLKESSKPKEHQEKGQVKTKVYMDYIKAASRLGVASFLLCILLSQAASIRGSLRLTRLWMTSADKSVR